MVDVGWRQLRLSRDRLEKQAAHAADDGDEATAGLLLFYAAECGLKAELVKSVLRCRDTSGLPAHLRTHDLRELAKELGLPRTAQGGPDRCRRGNAPQWGARSNGSRYVESPDLHQAWRYGADLLPEDEKAALAALTKLIRECRERG